MTLIRDGLPNWCNFYVNIFVLFADHADDGAPYLASFMFACCAVIVDAGLQVPSSRIIPTLLSSYVYPH